MSAARPEGAPARPPNRAIGAADGAPSRLPADATVARLPAPVVAARAAVTPVFVLSLPRSGSTLVQRVLATHPEVATAAEPWILLPLLSALRERIPLAGAWHPHTVGALADFAGALPHGHADYRRAVHDAALRLYTDAAGPGARFFVDKTPPYYLVVDELFDVFPDGRFLFLWRNPLSVVSSVVETFCGGRWKPDDWVSGLFSGLANLVAAFERNAQRAVCVRFEDLVAGERTAWTATAGALGVPLHPAALERFDAVRLAGRFGDPTGVNDYSALATEPVDKWRDTICNPVRRAWCRRYLRWIGRHRLAVMGYDLDALLAALDAPAPAPPPAPRPASRVMLRDGADLARSFTRDVAKSQVLRRTRGPSAWGFLLR